MADEQLGYDGGRKAVKQDWWMLRGDTKDIVFAHELGAAAAVKTAQLEIELVASPYTTILSLTLADHSAKWDFTTDNEGIVTPAATDTVTLTPGQYRYDIQLTDQTDLVYTPVYGTFTISRDAVDGSGTSPYPAWTTLDDLEEQISDMASCALVTWLTAVVTGGAQSVIEVQNGAIATGTPGIRLILTNGSYEDDTIASIDGNEWTVAGTFAGEAAIGKPVRIL